MTNPEAIIAKVLELDEKATKGPWRWEMNLKGKQTHLSGGNPHFDLSVIDFKRWGMSEATPRFREDVDRMNIMHPAEKWAQPVKGREHHSAWFQQIAHPDADLIAFYRTAAPQLAKHCADLERGLRVAREALEKIETLKPESFDAFPADWSEQIAKCPECQGWCKTHPIMNGICDEHRRPLYAREKHEKHEGAAIGYRMKGIARATLSALDAEPVSQPTP